MTASGVHCSHSAKSSIRQTKRQPAINRMPSEVARCAIRTCALQHITWSKRLRTQLYEADFSLYISNWKEGWLGNLDPQTVPCKLLISLDVANAQNVRWTYWWLMWWSEVKADLSTGCDQFSGRHWLPR